MGRLTVERAPAAELIARPDRWLEETRADGRVRAGWSRATDAAVVLGSAQRLDVGPLPSGVGLLRRGTGGGAVLCDPSYLMLDVVLPADDRRVVDDLAASYRWLAERLLGALRGAGAGIPLRAVVPVEVRGLPAADREAGRLACFAGLGPYEIVGPGGGKLVGLAQRRRGRAALFQAAAYLRGGQDALADLLPLDGKARADLRGRLARTLVLEAVAPAFADDPPDVWSD